MEHDYLIFGKLGRPLQEKFVYLMDSHFETIDISNCHDPEGYKLAVSLPESRINDYYKVLIKNDLSRFSLSLVSMAKTKQFDALVRSAFNETPKS